MAKYKAKRLVRQGSTGNRCPRDRTERPDRPDRAPASARSSSAGSWRQAQRRSGPCGV